jgi:hypothetical protein
VTELENIDRHLKLRPNNDTVVCRMPTKILDLTTQKYHDQADLRRLKLRDQSLSHDACAKSHTKIPASRQVDSLVKVHQALFNHFKIAKPTSEKKRKNKERSLENMKTMVDPSTTNQDLKITDGGPRKDTGIPLMRKKQQFKNFDS